MKGKASTTNVDEDNLQKLYPLNRESPGHSHCLSYTSPSAFWLVHIDLNNVKKRNKGNGIDIRELQIFCRARGKNSVRARQLIHKLGNK